MSDDHIERSVENKTEIAVTRWIDRVKEERGCSRRQAALLVLDVLNGLATGDVIPMRVPKKPEGGGA